MQLTTLLNILSHIGYSLSVVFGVEKKIKLKKYYKKISFTLLQTILSNLHVI